MHFRENGPRSKGKKIIQILFVIRTLVVQILKLLQASLLKMVDNKGIKNQFLFFKVSKI
jgi:hypothetical protein